MANITRVLVLVKASPQPSKQYGDTVCVAGAMLGGEAPEWIRLYPVPFRYLDGSSQFQKYDIIRVETRAAGADKRPESRKINAATIKIEGQVKGWKNRDSWLNQFDDPDMCALQGAVKHDLNSQSLAAIRPAEVQGLDFSSHPGWSREELARFEQYRNQGDLFREYAPQLLDPPPLTVHLRYRCTADDCSGHSQRIIDWELTALQRRFRSRGQDELERAITRNFLETPFSIDRQPLIYVGNQENVRRRASFTILGLYYPRKTDVQQKERLF